MKNSRKENTGNVWTILFVTAIPFVIIAMTPIFDNQKLGTGQTDDVYYTIPAEDGQAKDSIESVRAFMNVYKVLMSPRCVNCHPSGDVPLQGDDSHLHAMLPRRGVDGKGLYAMKCTNCHQSTNTPGLNMPPGNTTWHLPPSDMTMVFQGKSAHDLAEQLLNPKLNGNKNVDELLEHVSDDLVMWGWEPGDGRTKPPLDYEDFTTAWITWLEKGAYAPKK